MRRATLLTGAATAALATVTSIAGPAQAAAPVRTSVVIVAHTDIGPTPSEFESSVPGCASGTVVDAAGGPHFTPWGGVFVGVKDLTCDGGAAGFSIRLTARFGPGGSTGSWVLVDAWGDLDGVRGSGSLVGIPTGADVDRRRLHRHDPVGRRPVRAARTASGAATYAGA